MAKKFKAFVERDKPKKRGARQHKKNKQWSTQLGRVATEIALKKCKCLFAVSACQVQQKQALFLFALYILFSDLWSHLINDGTICFDTLLFCMFANHVTENDPICSK